MRILMTATLILALASFLRAADVAAPPVQQDETSPVTADAPSDAHPRVPEHPAWARNLVVTIAVLFVLAFVMVPIVRAVMPQEVEPPHAHDEHGHGAHDDHHAPAPAPAHGHAAPGHGHAGHH